MDFIWDTNADSEVIDFNIGAAKTMDSYELVGVYPLVAALRHSDTVLSDCTMVLGELCTGDAEACGLVDDCRASKSSLFFGGHKSDC